MSQLLLNDVRGRFLSGSGSLELPFAMLGIPPTGTGTYLLRSTLTWDSGAPVTTTVLSVTDGTANNRFMTQHVQASGIRAGRTTAGSAGTSVVSTAVPTNGISFGMAMIILDSRQIRIMVNAAAAVIVNSGPTAPLTLLHIYSVQTGLQPSLGIWKFRYLPLVLSDADAAAAVASFV